METLDMTYMKKKKALCSCAYDFLMNTQGNLFMGGAQQTAIAGKNTITITDTTDSTSTTTGEVQCWFLEELVYLERLILVVT